jgi:hypothetical protein
MKEIIISDLFNLYIVDRVQTMGDVNETPFDALLFYHSSIYEFNETMKKLTSSSTPKKFPFIWINNGGGNVVSRFEQDTQYISIGQIILGTLSSPNYVSDVRTERVFKPILIPLKDNLMYVLDGNNTRAIQLLNQTYESENHYFYGKDKDENPFNDFIDVIEIKDIELRIKKDCET